MSADGFGVSVWEDEKVLEPDRDDDRTTVTVGCD